MSTDGATTRLTVSHWLPTSHPIHAQMEGWARSVTARSGGTIETVVHPAAELVDTMGTYQAVRRGDVGVGLCAPNYEPQRFPHICVADQLLTIANAVGGSVALDRWYRQYLAREMPDVHFCFAYVMGPGVIHSNRRIVRPSDLKGLRMRPASTTVAELFKGAGADVRRTPLVDTPDAVARGELDGVAVPWGGLMQFGIDRHFKYHLDVPLYATGFVIAMNKDAYLSMSPQQRSVIDDHSTTDWSRHFGTEWTKFEVWGRDELMRHEGHEVIVPSDDDLREWQAAAAQFRGGWETQVRAAGDSPERIWAEFNAALRQENGAL